MTCLPLLYCWASFVLQYRAYSYALSLLVTCSPTMIGGESGRQQEHRAVVAAVGVVVMMAVAVVVVVMIAG